MQDRGVFFEPPELEENASMAKRQMWKICLNNLFKR